MVMVLKFSKMNSNYYHKRKGVKIHDRNQKNRIAEGMF